jgi:hypothetical protein
MGATINRIAYRTTFLCGLVIGTARRYTTAYKKKGENHPQNNEVRVIFAKPGKYRSGSRFPNGGLPHAIFIETARSCVTAWKKEARKFPSKQ